MDRYLQRADRYKKAAALRMLWAFGLMLVGLVFAGLTDSPDVELSLSGFLASVCWFAYAGICIRGYHYNMEMSAVMERRSASHQELMKYAALGSAILEANKNFEELKN